MLYTSWIDTVDRYLFYQCNHIFINNNYNKDIGSDIATNHVSIKCNNGVFNNIDYCLSASE